MSFIVRVTSHGERLIKKHAPKEISENGFLKKELKRIGENPFPSQTSSAKKLKNVSTADYRWDFDYKGVTYRIGYFVEKRTKTVYIAGLKKRGDLSKRYEF